MENIYEQNQSNNHNIFSNINFVKNNKINYNYSQCINKMNNVTNKLENLIDIIDNSIGKEESKKFKRNKNINNQSQKRPMSAKIIRRPDKYSFRKESKKKLLNFSQFNTNYEENYSQKINNKKKYKLNISKSMILNKSKKINDNNFRKRNHLKNASKIQNSSVIVGDFYQRRDNKLYTYKIKKDSSSINRIFNSNTSTNKINNSSMITLCYPKSYTTKSRRPQSANINSSSINNYAFKKGNYKNISSYNSSKNFSHSHYKTLSDFYFDNLNYSKLKPKYLMDFLKNSKKIKNSYKKELKDVHMKRKTQELLEIAKKEIKLKDPEYYKKQIFKSIIKVKKTLNYVQKMRGEQKYMMDYYGPGNIDNKGYIRKKNANLIRFCDQICHMKDEKFYIYSKLLNDLYPHLLKNAVKIKYKISERDPINEKKMQENEEKINKLISVLKKH